MGRPSKNRIAHLKRRLFEILEIASLDDRVSVIVNRLIFVCILLNVTAVILETEKGMAPFMGMADHVIESATVAVFIMEYVARLWVCTLEHEHRGKSLLRVRLRYALRPMVLVDLVAILPPFLALVLGAPQVATFTAFRLLRFLKLARYSPGMSSLFNAIASEKNALAASGVIMAGLIIGTASLMHAVEGGVQPDKFGSIPKAMYWAVTTLTTVGYGDVVPITAAGRAIAGVVMLMGFTMFALPVGIIATAFAREIHQQDFVVTWSMVARVPLFSELGAKDVAEIMKMLRSQNVAQGVVIARQGEAAHNMYFIVSGTVEVELPNQRVRLTDGAFFGEMALLKRSNRSANVTAVSGCKLLVLDATDLQQLMQRQPDIARLIRAEARARSNVEGVTPRGDLAAEELAGGHKA